MPPSPRVSIDPNTKPPQYGLTDDNFAMVFAHTRSKLVTDMPSLMEYGGSLLQSAHAVIVIDIADLNVIMEECRRGSHVQNKTG